MTRSPTDIIASLFPANEVFSLRPYAAADSILAALAGEGWTLIRRDEAVAVQCPRCEGNGEHLSHPDQDCDVCADPRDWGEHVVECARCAGGGQTLAWLMPYEEDE